MLGFLYQQEEDETFDNHNESSMVKQIIYIHTLKLNSNHIFLLFTRYLDGSCFFVFLYITKMKLLTLKNIQLTVKQSR